MSDWSKVRLFRWDVNWSLGTYFQVCLFYWGKFGHGFCRFINFSVRQHVAKEARFAVSTAPDHIFCVTKHVDLLDTGDVRWSHVRIGK